MAKGSYRSNLRRRGPLESFLLSEEQKERESPEAYMAQKKAQAFITGIVQVVQHQGNGVWAPNYGARNVKEDLVDGFTMQVKTLLTFCRRLVTGRIIA